MGGQHLMHRVGGTKVVFIGVGESFRIPGYNTKIFDFFLQYSS